MPPPGCAARLSPARHTRMAREKHPCFPAGHHARGRTGVSHPPPHTAPQWSESFLPGSRASHCSPEHRRYARTADWKNESTSAIWVTGHHTTLPHTSATPVSRFSTPPTQPHHHSRRSCVPQRSLAGLARECMNRRVHQMSKLSSMWRVLRSGHVAVSDNFVRLVVRREDRRCERRRATRKGKTYDRDHD